MIGINELEVVYEFEPEKNITLKSLNRLLNH